ncbi:polysaccharide deacetylase family protein [Pseudothauera nasutitermitis]|uniref:Polysaccharide deacetylase family protein n=1 Tax=Pseudothauera nasutitermitis TaxID=2565930 RepID=A0A4V3WBL0_9RHOO|nr:polysaccharide deacetylase family protein [Pseudothauera nasutitermitis]THF63653.1 polysaccharide deacetylase family protein [Pseudothauera nasutitermitis]
MSLRLAMRLAAPPGPGGALSILIFHRVLAAPDPLFPDEPDVRRFDALLGWLRQWFNVLPLADALVRLRAGRLPARAAAITFDDGYADNLLQAVPLLRRHGLHATFFIASGFLDGGRMWNDTLIEAVRATRLTALDAGIADLPELPLDGVEARRAALARLIPAVKHLPPPERAAVVQRVAGRCGADLPTDLMLTSTQLRTLRAAGMDVGAHTLTHPILARTDADEARREIAEGRALLENILGERVALFAYPNGKPGADYRRAHVDMVRELGFDAALSTRPGVNAAGADFFQLARFTAWDRPRWRFGLRMLDNLRQRAPVTVDA